jgi:TonB family protein
MLAPATLEAALTFLLACAVKLTVVLASAHVIALALRRRSSALRHHVWAATILGSLLLPVFTWLLPAWHSATLGTAAAALIPSHGAASNPATPTTSSTTIDATTSWPIVSKVALVILLVWFLGFSLAFLRLLVGLTRLAWVSVRAKPIFEDVWMREVLKLSNTFKISRSVRLLECHSALSMPLTCGLLRPIILLPAGAAQWPEECRRIVLSHELAHIARNDWFLQICAELARALYWFHPLVWLAATSLRHESERACDDAVLLSGVAASRYASQLLDLARTLENSGRAWSTALAIARPSNLERRFAAMLSPSINRGHLSAKAKFLIPFLAVCVLVPLAAVRLPAENLSGKISGSIHDPSGTGVANATIIMSNHAANTIDMTTSDRVGNFSFKALPTGDYELQVVKPGFEAYRIPQVALQSGRDFSQAILLQLGSITERLQVTPDNSEKPTVAETTSGQPSRLRIGGSVEAAKIITKVQPVYPESAKSAGIMGTVVLHAVIGMDGKPLSLHVMNSQIDPDLARAAVEAVSQWRYRPTLLNGNPVEVDTTITVNFTLQP